MARIEARSASTETAVCSEARARLKVSGADYGMATAEVRDTTAEMGAAAEMPTPAEMRAPTAEVPAPTAEVGATTATTTKMTTAAATSTVSSSGAGRHGGTQSERGRSEDPKSPTQKSCLSHHVLHSVAAPLAALDARATRLDALQQPSFKLLEQRLGHYLRYGLSTGTFPVTLSTVPMPEERWRAL